MPLGYFTDSTPLTPLRNPFNVLVDGVNANETSITDLGQSRAIQTFRWANATERTAQTGMQAGDMGYQVDTGTQYRHAGGAWVPSPQALIATRTSTTPAVGAASFANLSANANWTGPGYSNGWTIPTSGNYLVSWSIEVIGQPAVAGISINNASPASGSDLALLSSAPVVQGGAFLGQSSLVTFSAGDILRLFAITGSGSATLRASQGRFTLLGVA